MKITDFLPTDASKKATAKLTKQVQMASVAAAKEPKLRLGVLSIDIAQKQSTGDTSRVNEAAEPPLKERGVASLLQKLATGVLDSEFGSLQNISEAGAQLGVYAYSLGKEDGDKLITELVVISSITSKMISYRDYSTRLEDAITKLHEKHDATALPLKLIQILESVSFLSKMSEELAKTVEDASEVLSFLDRVSHMQFENDEEGFKQQIAAKVLKKLGLLK
jgi:hypothetical protein